MSIGILVILGIAAFFLYTCYVSLVKKKNRVREALSGIDVQLQKRNDLVPNILTIANKFMEHEKELLTEVAALRARANQDYDKTDSTAVKEHLQTAGQLSSSLGKIMIAVEAYPELKSDTTMMQAQQTYNEVEAQIAAARRFYNSTVTELNNAVEIFPGSLMAPMAGAKLMPFFEASEEARKAVDAREYLN
ncbi:MAG: LemA family protein [Bdellovibrionales bacterium]|nr:LemA family protein [Bdellovibrionales bacterium]